jgi:D-galactarolactone cycloisomerase
LIAHQTSNATIRIRSVRTFLFRAPTVNPVRTSFAVSTARTALLVQLEDQDGAVGWGEVYATFPPGAAEHRVRLIETLFAPLATAEPIVDPDALYERLTRTTRVLALQSGELGPIAQCISGIDIAAWDLFARRAGAPLSHLLGDGGRSVVAAYASGINPDSPEKVVAAEWEKGFRAFKLKLGFGREADLRNMEAVRKTLGEGVPVAVDANQAWSLEEAVAMSRALAPFQPLWLEEPLFADTPLATWTTLSQRSPVLLATGENLRGEAAFRDAIASGAFAVLQPDPIKWGGLSALRHVAREIGEAGLTFCPHCFGGGIGLIASAHLVAATGSARSRLEVDHHPNPLREGLAAPYPALKDGMMEVPDGPGLGVAPDMAAVREFLVRQTG